MAADIVAATAQGRLRGARDGQALRFLGIPYAESPATAGRFAAPVPLLQTVGGVRAVAAEMAERLGPLHPATLEAMPSETILAARQAVTASAGTVGGQRDAGAVTTLLAGGIPLPWAPYADGEVVTEEPLTAAASPDVFLLT